MFREKTYAQLNARLQEESFFQYETGRYLYNEKEGSFPPFPLSLYLSTIIYIYWLKLAARYIRCNIAVLHDVAISAMGAQSCVT